jgi:hypothetical protein
MEDFLNALIPCPVINQQRSAIAKSLNRGGTCGLPAQLTYLLDLNRLPGSFFQISCEFTKF